MLLNHRDIFERHFHAEVAARHHDAVRRFEDLLDVVYALDGLYFGNDAHAAVVGHKNVTDVLNVLGRAREGGRDEIVTHAAAELNVGAVLPTDKGHRQVGAGEVHALVVGDGAAVYDRADNLSVGLGVNAKPDEPVIDQNSATHRNVRGQIFVGDRRPRRVAQNLVGSKGESLAFLEYDLAALKIAKADLGAFGVKQGSDRKAEFPANTDNPAELGFMFLMSAVGKVESCHIHACRDKLAEHHLTLTRRSYGADDLGLAHLGSSL